eukprot:m.14201 g.14201  ORF g.14201 m.14201 type:complete len:91 (-) comp6160_c0_seq1:4964-5236(-)
MLYEHVDIILQRKTITNSAMLHWSEKSQKVTSITAKPCPQPHQKPNITFTILHGSCIKWRDPYCLEPLRDVAFFFFGKINDSTSDAAAVS